MLFTYSGVPDSGAADGAGVGRGSDEVDGGAVVVSGTIDAGGGSDKSISADKEDGSWTGDRLQIAKAAAASWCPSS